jgi:response regulator NasT
MSKKILLVCGNYVTRQMWGVILGENGYETAGEAASAVEAAEMAAGLAPDMALLGADVSEAGCAAAIQNLAAMGVKVVVCSHKSGIGEIAGALLAGASDFLAEPFTGEELIAAVNGAFGAAREYNAVFLRELADKYAKISPRLTQEIAGELKKRALSENPAGADEFWRGTAAVFKQQQEKNLAEIRKNIYGEYNTTVELGRTELDGNAISVVFGRAYLAPGQPESLKKGAGFRLDVEISPEGTPVTHIFANGRLAAKGRPRLIKDSGLDNLGNIGVEVTCICGEDGADGVFAPLKGRVIKLDNRAFHPDEKKEHSLSRFYVMLLCKIFFNGKLIAAGRLSNPRSVYDPGAASAERHYSVMVDEVYAGEAL